MESGQGKENCENTGQCIFYVSALYRIWFGKKSCLLSISNHFFLFEVRSENSQKKRIVKITTWFLLKPSYIAQYIKKEKISIGTDS